MGQLGVEKADDLAPGTENAGVIFDVGLAASLGTKCGGMRLQSWRRMENFPALA
jgi:hypothetical protein